MALKNTPTQYGSVNKWIHWLSALAVIGLLAVGWYMTSLNDEVDAKWTMYSVHKQVGLGVLLLTGLRMLWVLHTKHPKLPGTIPALERLAAHTGHLFLYLVLVFMPLSGWIMSTASGYTPKVFGHEFPMPGIPVNESVAKFTHAVHEWLPWFIVALIGAHILGALKHHFIDRNEVLVRMLPGKHK